MARATCSTIRGRLKRTPCASPAPASPAPTYDAVLASAAFLFLLLLVQQRSAAPAGAAAAGVRFAHRLADAPVDVQAIVVRELVTCVDRASRVNEHATLVVLESLAVRVARVVDPSCRVATHAGVD